jgi:uncharacterized protein YlxW (UPF0749 family)
MASAENSAVRPGDEAPARAAADDDAEAVPQPAAPDQPATSSKKTRVRGAALKLSIGLLAGLLVGATAITAQGADLRPNRTSDLAELVAQAQQSNTELAARAAELRRENEELAAAQGAPAASADPDQQLLSQIVGLAPVKGPAVRVTLTDAPADFAPPGINGDLLVVHEQDIQRVVNALFAGGAEAMTIQDQRVIATTAVKCVGNTVVLHGVPYAPPYVITAIGNQSALEAALAADPGVQIYRQYAQAYQLGYQQQRIGEVTMPAFSGSLPQLTRAAR